MPRINFFDTPLGGAINIGVFESALTALGAAARGHDVIKPAMIMIIGGSITGAIIGYLKNILARNQYQSNNLNFHMIRYSLQATATLSAPLVGNVITQLDNDYASTITDNIAGCFIFLGGLAILSSTIFICNRIQGDNDDFNMISIDSLLTRLLNIVNNLLVSASVQENYEIPDIELTYPPYLEDREHLITFEQNDADIANGNRFIP